MSTSNDEEYERIWFEHNCNMETISDDDKNCDKSEIKKRLSLIDKNAANERQTLFLAYLFKWHEPLNFNSSKQLFESDIINSKCAQECYKQVKRAEVELIISDGDFSKVGKLPSSHLDVLCTIGGSQETERRSRIKTIYNEIIESVPSQCMITASDISSHIEEKFNPGKPKKEKVPIQTEIEVNADLDFIFDEDQFDVDNATPHSASNSTTNKIGSQTNANKIGTVLDEDDDDFISMEQLQHIAKEISDKYTPDDLALIVSYILDFNKDGNFFVSFKSISDHLTNSRKPMTIRRDIRKHLKLEALPIKRA